MFLRPLRLVFEAVLHSFLNESEPWGILYPQWSSPIFYPTTKVQNSEIFSPRMSTKCKIFSRILFADQKRKIRLKPFFFSSPLFDLTLLPVYIMTVIKVKLRGRVKSFSFGEQNSSLIWWVYDEQFASFVTNNILFVGVYGAYKQHYGI